MWSAWLAPYYEQTNLANAMWILPEGGHWDDGDQGASGSNGDWASPYPGFANASITSGVNDPANYGVGGAAGPATERCVAACETVVSILRCPSSALPEHVYGPSYEDWIVQKRVPINYAVVRRQQCHERPGRHVTTTTISPILQLYVDTDVKQVRRRVPARAVRSTTPTPATATGSRSRRSPTAPRTRSSSARNTTRSRPATT